MLFSYLSFDPLIIGIPLLIQILSYVKILRKMGKNGSLGVIPFMGEWAMTQDLFRTTRAFWRPAIVTVAMLVTAVLIGGSGAYFWILMLVAMIVYGVFMIRLYTRLAKQFGKGKLFSLGLIFLPSVFLPVLAFGRSKYLGPREFRHEKELSKGARTARKVIITAISIAEIAALVVGCFIITMLVHPLRPVTEYLIKETQKDLASVTDSGEIISREDTMGADYEKIVEEQRTREYFFPDHSNDKKAVVMEYVIGSNLEDARGFASINIAQMIDATKKGDGLDFVMQAGGSGRWFTSGIEDETVGRYLISGGKIETAEMLDPSTCMSDPENLADFIKWTKKNYPADRYMLVLWDHGGGFAMGYGQDDLNEREDADNIISASEIINAIKESGVTFDMIGFDACLMQNIEYANALEPYADFYLASEETEPGTGWYYTEGFGRLAVDPDIDTKEFARIMISTYDQSNRVLHDGEPDHTGTLSLVDLTLVKPVYRQLTGLYEKATNEIADNHAVFANMSAARSGAYQFYDGEQVDMINYITCLKKADYKQQVMKDEELDKIAETAKACVVYRNSDAAEGINGIAIDFPYTSLDMYDDEYKQLKAVKYNKERRFFNRFCSIMGSQQMAQNDLDSFWGYLNAKDYTDRDWYIKGFEDYDTSKLFVDIPVTETEDGYLPELPDKTWDTILDCKVAAYLVTEDGLMYIGKEHFSEEDAEGHPLVSMDGIWARVNGHVVCYEADEPLVTEEGTIFRGTVNAKLNGTDDIVLHIEWDPVTDETAEAVAEAALTGEEITGRVVGYSFADEEESFFLKKGLEQFETGDTLEFIFDFYDEEGNLIKTGTYGDKLHVITDERLTVKDELFESGTEIQYFGILTDVYQRELMTEEIREQVM